MSIEKKIKDAFTRRKNAIFDPETQPNLYKMSNFLRKAGYRLNDAIRHGDDRVEIILTPIKDDPLHPDITHHMEDNKFYIHIKKYGELEASDVEEIIKGYEAALEVVKYLDNVLLQDYLEASKKDEE